MVYNRNRVTVESNTCFALIIMYRVAFSVRFNVIVTSNVQNPLTVIFRSHGISYDYQLSKFIVFVRFLRAFVINHIRMQKSHVSSER